MKTFFSYMAAVLLVTAMTGLTGHSQDAKPDKQSKKEAKRAAMVTNFHVQDSLLTVGQYVLEANYLQNKYGSMVSVSSNLNFVMVNGLRGILQTGSDLRQGYNGVGGVTAEGSIENYKMLRDTKHLTHTITFSLMTNLGTFDIFMNVYGDGNAQATISGTTSGKLTWRGRFVARDNSRVYKGQQTY
jgi:hypothetical protein